MPETAMKPEAQQVTLLFLRREQASVKEILLAMKKRGFGEGRWNGVGGKADVNESIEQTAVRECQEEIGVTPTILRKVGEMVFYMSDRPDFCHDCHIYEATEWQDEPVETEEMRPQWFREDAIPYDHMWTDDKLWLPKLLAGQRFRATITLGPNDAIEQADIADVETL